MQKFCFGTFLRNDFGVLLVFLHQISVLPHLPLKGIAKAIFKNLIYFYIGKLIMLTFKIPNTLKIKLKLPILGFGGMF